MAQSATDRATIDLLGWEPPSVALGFDDDELRGGALASRISRAVGLALKRSTLPREDIAFRMSDFLPGQRVTKAMLDAYSAEGKATHQITVERFIALVHVTGCLDLLAVITEGFGHSVVPDRYAAIIELHLVEEHEREIAAHKASLVARARQSR
jgi:hypothetical protein